MTADPDAIGPDGTVHLRRYLLHENIWWLSVGCSGCGHLAPVGVRAAIEIMGSGEATVGQLARRLRCGACGGRRVLIQIAADTRSADLRRRDGPPPETRADPRRRG